MWRIYYADGLIFTSEDGLSKDAPSRGIQAIVQDHPDVGVEIVTGGDYYVNENEHWRSVDIFGLFDYLMESGLVLFGRTISRKEYQEIMRVALKDKAGWLPRERKE